MCGMVKGLERVEFEECTQLVVCSSILLYTSRSVGSSVE